MLNIISIAFGLMIFALYAGFIELVSGEASIEEKIANAHVIFLV